MTLLTRTHGATVSGRLTDISLQALDTTLLFAPTNEVLVTAAGLSAGPPRSIGSTGGQFSLTLDTGDYTVSLPLIPWRHPFVISVPNTNATINITNLLAQPRTYIYTNRFIPPLHVNTGQVVVWSTNGEKTLLDAAASIPADSLGAGNVLSVEAFGVYADPASTDPDATLKLKLGATTLLSASKPASGGAWHLRAAITFRSAGTNAAVAAGFASLLDNVNVDPFLFGSQTATVDTTAALSVNLTATIADSSHAENITCHQLIIRLE